MNVLQLSRAERNQLFNELMAQENAEKKQLKEQRDAYKLLVNDVVEDASKKLEQVSLYLSEVKAEIFNSFAALVDLKKELYGYKDGQKSHSFTNNNGQTIEIGCRVTDGWDDTIDAGISKVNEYIDSLATNQETAQLVRMIQGLLKKDMKGNLKANRILELQKMADEIENPLFSEGVDIIRTAYKPVRTAYFVEGRYKDNTGKNRNHPLSITSAEFPLGADVCLANL